LAGNGLTFSVAQQFAATFTPPGVVTTPAPPGRLSANNVIVATFTDAGGAENVGNYSAVIDWGDGSAA